MQPPGSGTQTWYASNQTLMTHAPRAYPQMKNASRGSTVRLRKGQRSPRRDKDTNVLNRSGLNPRRACIKRALTPSACVCKPAAAKFTSNYERSPAWHSATDWKLNSTFVTDIQRAPETRSGRLRCCGALCGFCRARGRHNECMRRSKKGAATRFAVRIVRVICAACIPVVCWQRSQRRS